MASIRTISLALTLLFVNVLPVSALQLKTATDVYITGDYQEDLFLTGTTVNFDGNITGDVLTAARYVTINGTVDGNVNAGAQKISINGEICRSLRAFGETVNVMSRVDGDLIAFGADLTLGNDATVGRDLAMFGAEVYIDGTVDGKVYASGGTVTIAGRINGDVRIKADHVSVTPDAIIGGELNYTSKNKGSIAPEAQINGGVKWKKKSSESAESNSYVPFPSGLMWSLIFLGGSLVLGALVILIRREGVVMVIEEVKKNAALDGLIGVAVIIVIPIALILIGFTFVGLPITFAGLSIYFLMFLISRIIVAITLGLVLLRLVKREGRISLGWSLLVGMILLALGYKIPILGWVVYFVAWAIGAGALTMVMFRKKAPTPSA